MFDIGFIELLVISVIALLFIGPERLPETVRTVGLWFGRLKRQMQTVKSDMRQELGLDEIQRQLHNEAMMASFKEDIDKARQGAQEFSEYIEGISPTQLKPDASKETEQMNTDGYPESAQQQRVNETSVSYSPDKVKTNSHS